MTLVTGRTGLIPDSLALECTFNKTAFMRRNITLSEYISDAAKFVIVILLN